METAIKAPKYKIGQWVRFYRWQAWKQKRPVYKGCIVKSWQSGQAFVYNIGRNKRTYWWVDERDIIEGVEE